MIDVDCSIHIIVISITLNRHAIFMLDRVTSPTILSLLSKFSLSDGLYVWVGVVRVLTWGVHAWNHLVVVWSRVEELLSRHHHLLLILVAVWCFSLIHKVEQMGLIILGNTVSCSNPVASNTAWVDAKRACSISITSVGNILMMSLVERLSSMMLLSLEIVHILLSSIALSDVFHEVTIVHSIPHLCLVLVTTFAWILRISKSANPRLIKHLLFLDLTIDMGEHLMNPWIICWLQKDTVVSGVHLINAQRSVTSCVTAALLPHSVCHKESLIWFLSTKPII